MVTKEQIESLSKRFGISVKEFNRLNKDLWYHGTTFEDAVNIEKTGVIAHYNIGTQLDFGVGFYLTDTEERASSYISRIPVAISDGGGSERKEWAVIEFTFNPCEYLLEEENFNTPILNFPKHNKAFAEFVLDNRMYNVYNEKPHGYDIIWGVMSDSLPVEIIASFKRGLLSRNEAIEKLQKTNSMKQLYLGTQNLCSRLRVNRIIQIRKEELYDDGNA